MTDWTAFGAVAIAITTLVLLLARATQSLLRPREHPVTDSSGVGEESDPANPLDAMSTAVLLLNVAGTQTLLLLLLLGGIWYTDVPLGSLGVAVPSRTELGLGVALGVGLSPLNRAAVRLGRRVSLGGHAAANRTGAAGEDAADRAGAAGEDAVNRSGVAGADAADRAGAADADALRSALAPETLPGWVALLLVVLPVVAVFEELLFRGALVGGLAAGFGLSAPVLVAASAAAFALGHGVQGRVGVVVTGALGLVLGAVFVWTGSLAVVVVAHYLLNALEFVVCEGIRG